MAAKRKRRETFGAVRKLPSGRYQASYLDPAGALDDAGRPKRHNAPVTFDAMTDARAWLSLRQSEITRGEWHPVEKLAPVTFATYASDYIATRTVRGMPLKPRTRAGYEQLLSNQLEPFASKPLDKITPDDVRKWYAALAEGGKLTVAARAYRLLGAVFTQAVADGRIHVSPATIRGAVKASTGRRVEPPTDAELAIITATIDSRLSLMVEVAAWGGLRFGELTELRRGDLAFHDGAAVVAITRAVSYVKGKGFVVGTPKSAAGIRTVTLPGTLTPALRARLDAIAPTDDALLFPALKDPATHMNSGAFHTFWRTARAAAGRDDMPFHALRHYGLTRYAQAGATVKEIMVRAGHNDVQTAMRYQHEAGRDAELAQRMLGSV